MVAAGAVAGRIASWNAAGWVVPDEDEPPCLSLRRSVLDPLLRDMAARTPGVGLLLGHTPVGLLEDGPRVAGVRLRTDGGERELRGRLVVAADGHRSPVAQLAGVPTDEGVNGRFLYWAYERLPAFRADPPGALEAFLAPLPDGPDLRGAERCRG